MLCEVAGIGLVAAQLLSCQPVSNHDDYPSTPCRGGSEDGDRSVARPARHRLRLQHEGLVHDALRLDLPAVHAHPPEGRRDLVQRPSGMDDIVGGPTG